MKKGSSQGAQRRAEDARPESQHFAGFYILSLKWTRGEVMTWWRPDNAGYTQDLGLAGIYSAADVLGARDYYDDGEDTLAVPVQSAARFVVTRRPVANARSIHAKLRRARNRAISKLRIQNAPPTEAAPKASPLGAERASAKPREDQ